MGKFDKERVGQPRSSLVTQELLGRQYDSTGPTRDSFGRLSPNQDQLDGLARSLARMRELGQPPVEPQRQTASVSNPIRKGSQKGPKQTYNNRSPRGRGR